jgi:AcrR family transcriptional regulator
MPRGTRANGVSSRRAILERSLTLAALGGQQTASIGALATALGMSKSGVFAHFGSKDALDLAVSDAAAERFARAVVVAADSAPRGVARLAALVEGWLAEVASVSPALVRLLDDGPGAAPACRLHARAWRKAWRERLAAECVEARRIGELGPGADPAQGAFEIDALLAAAAAGFDADGPAAIDAARAAIENRLQQLAAER